MSSALASRWIPAVIEIILSLSENVYLASRWLFRRISARTF